MLFWQGSADYDSRRMTVDQAKLVTSYIYGVACMAAPGGRWYFQGSGRRDLVALTNRVANLRVIHNGESWVAKPGALND